MFVGLLVLLLIHHHRNLIFGKVHKYFVKYFVLQYLDPLELAVFVIHLFQAIDLYLHLFAIVVEPLIQKEVMYSIWNS